MGTLEIREYKKHSKGLTLEENQPFRDPGGIDFVHPVGWRKPSYEEKEGELYIWKYTFMFNSPSFSFVIPEGF